MQNFYKRSNSEELMNENENSRNKRFPLNENAMNLSKIQIITEKKLFQPSIDKKINFNVLIKKANSEKTVKFSYLIGKDNPTIVAKEMVEALGIAPSHIEFIEKELNLAVDKANKEEVKVNVPEEKLLILDLEKHPTEENILKLYQNISDLVMNTVELEVYINRIIMMYLKRN